MANILRAFNSRIKHWYIPFILGILFLVLALYTIMQPQETYRTLSFIFSCSFLLSGLATIYFSISNKDVLEAWGWYFANGIFSFILGIYLLASPTTAAAILPFAVGLYLLIYSIQGLVAAIELKKYGILEWGTLAIISILGIVFSCLLIFNPVFATFTLITLTALGLAMLGIFSIMLGLALKKLKNNL